MRSICGLSIHLLLIIGQVFSGVRASEHASVRSSATNKKTILEDNVEVRSFITADQKRNLENNVKSGMKDLILQRKHESDNSRILEEGDWDFINDILEDLDFEFVLDLEEEFAGVEFTFGTFSCDSFSINDIVTEGISSTTEYNLSFRVTGITVSCIFDYEYDGGFFLRGSGDVETSITQGTFVDTELIFTSPNFDESGPTDASIACSANVDIGDISFDDFFLDLLVAPLLPIFLEPIIEPLICDTIVILDELLSDGVMALNEILEEFTAPLPTELTNILYPEQLLSETLSSSTVPFVDSESIIDSIFLPLEELVSNLTDDILELNGTLAIPLELPITENITLNEIRVVGFDGNFDYDVLSLRSQYTYSSQYEQEYVGIEIELNVINEDGTIDTVLVTSGINDLEFNFALLLVLEDISDDIPWLEDPALALESLDCILDTIYATEIAGLSLTSGSLEGLEISGLSGLLGPQQLINEVSEAVFFMYDSVLNIAVTNFFESDVRSVINDLIQPELPTCLEKLSGETVYVPAENGCLKFELFDGGVAASDPSDSECANEVHASTQIFSQFDYVDGDNVYFKEGNLGFSGVVKFVEDSSLPEIDFLPYRVDVQEKTFILLLSLPTCTTNCYS